MQKIWRSFNEVKGAGFFIWTVIECEGVTANDVERWSNFYIETLDGTYILQPTCNHFWSEVEAYEFFWDSSENYFNVIPVGDGPVPF